MYVACRSSEVRARTGGLRYWNCPITLPGPGVQALQPFLLLGALEQNPPIASTVWRADPASEGIAPGTCLVRRPLPEGLKRYSDAIATS